MSTTSPLSHPMDERGVDILGLEDCFDRDGYTIFRQGNATDNGEEYTQRLERIFLKEDLNSQGKDKLEILLNILREATIKVESILAMHDYNG